MKQYNEGRDGARESRVNVREIVIITHELDWVRREWRCPKERDSNGSGSMTCRSQGRSKDSSSELRGGTE